MRVLRSIALLALCALPIVAAHAAPVTYDATAAFTTASNPNGVWAYGYGVPGSTFTAFTVSGTAFAGNSGYSYWSNATNGIPLVGHNTNASPTPGFTPFPPSTDLWIHPGTSDALDAIVRFTVPTTTNYNLSSIFERADQTNGGGDGVGISIYDNGSLLFGRTVLPATTYLGSISFSKTLILNAGDAITFVVDRNGIVNYDSTGLRLVVTQDPVPEPSSLLLLATGLVGAATAVRRKLIA